MPGFLRIDEFSITADGSLNARDRTRVSLVGFDLSTAPPPPGPPGSHGAYRRRFWTFYLGPTHVEVF